MTVIYSAQSEAPPKPTRATLLPLLIVLFLASYGILTMLVVEQGRTIESQRGLLREMLKDSAQLATLKSKMAREDSRRLQDKATAQTEQKQSDSGNSAAAPKGSDKQAKRPGKSSRSMKDAPEKPAADLQDVRRSTQVL